MFINKEFDMGVQAAQETRGEAIHGTEVLGTMYLPEDPIVDIAGSSYRLEVDEEDFSKVMRRISGLLTDVTWMGHVLDHPDLDVELRVAEPTSAIDNPATQSSPVSYERRPETEIEPEPTDVRDERLDAIQRIASASELSPAAALEEIATTLQQEPPAAEPVSISHNPRAVIEYASRVAGTPEQRDSLRDAFEVGLNNRVQQGLAEHYRYVTMHGRALTAGKALMRTMFVSGGIIGYSLANDEEGRVDYLTLPAAGAGIGATLGMAALIGIARIANSKEGIFARRRERVAKKYAEQLAGTSSTFPLDTLKSKKLVGVVPVDKVAES